MPCALTIMPHSFSVLNCAACDSKRLACAPNQGCQAFIWTPRNASFSTSNWLAAGIGVFVSDAFSVAFGRGVGVFESVAGDVDVHAERTNMDKVRTIQNLRAIRINMPPWE